MSKSFSSYLCTLRKSSGLTQKEMAELLGVSRAMVSKYETLAEKPGRSVAFAAEFIFNLPAHDIFPGLGDKARDAVVQRAVVFSKRLEHRSDERSKLVRRLLRGIAERDDSTSP